MLTVYWNNLNTFFLSGLHHYRPCAHQCFLVGKTNRFSLFDGCQGRRNPNTANYRSHHKVGFWMTSDLLQSFRSHGNFRLGFRSQ
ncbi:Uncharacterised protein [Mycobacterium tuberculosis]|nr:Uncharacterised protein [Mycobacterium tuberculosis]